MAKPIDFVMPVGNDANNAVSITSRTFRQPCNFDGKEADHARGLDLLLDNAENPSRLFAFVNGTLRFVPAQAPNDAALALDFEAAQIGQLADEFFKKTTVEAAPMRALYENFDPVQTQAKLELLLNDAAHRSRTGMIKPEGEDKAVKISEYLARPGASAATIVSQFLQGQLNLQILVKAGDVIGMAGPWPADTTKRRVLFSTLDLGQQHINPAFYLKLFLDLRAKQVTNLLRDASVMEALLNPTTFDKRPRVEVDVLDNTGSTVKQIPFSFGPHAAYHGFPLEGGVGLPTSLTDPVLHSKALNERRFAPPGTPTPSDPPNLPKIVGGHFQARKADTQENVEFYTTVQKLNRRATDAKAAVVPFWSRILRPPEIPATMQEIPISTVVNAICETLVVPAELFLTILGHESGAKRLAYRLEPLKDDARNRLRAAHLDATELRYDKTVGWTASIMTVDRQPAPAALNAPPTESDGRPQSKVRVRLTETMEPALTEKNKGHMVAKVGKKKKPSQEREPDPNQRRHVLIVDDSTGSRPLIREIKLLTPASATDFDMTIDDQQLYCNRGEVPKGARLLVCVGLPQTLPAAQETRPDLHYNPTDSCQAVDPSVNLTEAVQYTMPRDGTLRALYVEAGVHTADITVTVKINGTPSTLLVQTLKSTETRAAKADGSEAVEVNAGDKISLFVHSGAAYTGLRVRLHVAPKPATSIYMLTGAGGTTVNRFPTTGVVDATARIRGTDPANMTHPLTYGELLVLIETTHGPSISPGMAQTLISTARETLDALEDLMPDVYQRLAFVGVTEPPSPTGNQFKSYFVDATIGDPTAPKFGWLMQTPNALLVGAAKIRLGYIGRRTLPTLYDLPAVCAAYNQGSATFDKEKKGKSKVAKTTTWGVINSSPTYVPDSAVFFNAVVSLFEGDPTASPAVLPLNPLPRLRFRS